jgi:hypothetical protein
MSREFVREARVDVGPRHHSTRPPRRSISYGGGAALLLLEAARAGILIDAERETGLQWGDPQFRDAVQHQLDEEMSRPDEEQDRRLIQVARRYLRAAKS